MLSTPYLIYLFNCVIDFMCVILWIWISYLFVYLCYLSLYKEEHRCWEDWTHMVKTNWESSEIQKRKPLRNIPRTEISGWESMHPAPNCVIFLTSRVCLRSQKPRRARRWLETELLQRNHVFSGRRSPAGRTADSQHSF